MIEVMALIKDEDAKKGQERIDLVKESLKRVLIEVEDEFLGTGGTFSINVAKDFDVGEMKKEVLLVTEYPDDYLTECFEGGINRVYGRIERMGSQVGFVEQAQDLNLEAGLALDVFTPVDSLEKEALMKVDGIMLQGNKDGESRFGDMVLKKIVRLRNKGFKGEIIVKGLNDPKEVKECVDAGAKVVVVDEWLWQASDLESQLKLLTKGEI
jgi:pentose-5-phosphate-3-epimerase